MMTTDPHRLRQVLKNLMSNAFKFTERGEVTLSLELSAGGWSPSRTRLVHADRVIAIAVSDTGIGIKEDLHTAMFEAFAQADGSTARKYGGTGLGLSISRNLIELLGGEITLTSELGQGSTFTVYLPLDAEPDAAELIGSLTIGTPEPAPVAVRSTPGNDAFYNGAAAGVTALVVDDDFRNIFAMTALLERGQMNVYAAESGADALMVLEQQPDVDLVLMDIMMPGMNGYETMEAIRMRDHLAELPIIAVTGKVVGGERERCMAAGASGYIPKPVDTAELLDALSEWFPVIPRSRVSRP